MGKQFKTQELAEFKMADTGNGSFSGYASTFGNYDSVKEAVVKGAFADTLEQFKANGFIALNHDWNGEAIAFVKNAFEDDKGLFVECEFHSTTKAQEIRKIMQERAAAGKSNRMSIGYRVVKSTTTAQGKQLDQIRLYEASIVNVPANELASITNVKGDNGEGQADDDDPKAKDDAAKINQVLVKAMLLGDNAEGDMLMGGLESLTYRLRWKIWDTLGDSRLDNAEKINLCQAMIMEFASIAMRATESFLADPNAIATASAKAAELKAGRVLSDANFSFFSGLSERMKGVSVDMDNFLAEIAANNAKKLEPVQEPNNDDLTRKASIEAELLAMGIPPIKND